jgi:hypothetical protein
MLLKQFLSNDEHQELLEWAKTLNYYHKAYGKNVNNYYLTKPYIPLLDLIINKANKFYDTNYKIDLQESCIVQIKPTGWVSIHTDSYKHKKVKNFNILLSKSNEDGHILHGTKKVLWQEKDAYILDAQIEHGVSSVETEKEFYSILLYFYDNTK